LFLWQGFQYSKMYLNMLFLVQWNMRLQMLLPPQLIQVELARARVKVKAKGMVAKVAKLQT
jgi:hypothetical protein